MDIKMIYNARDFFGLYQMTEARATLTDANVKKAFSHLAKHHDCAVHIDHLSFFWNTMADHENGIMTVRHYTNWNNYSEIKKSFDQVKKIVYRNIDKNIAEQLRLVETVA